VEYSIIIPVFNYRESIDGLLQELTFILKSTEFEVIIVVDNLEEQVNKALIELRKKHPALQIRIIQLNRNVGQHKAICCGFTLAKGNRIVCLDDDNKFTFDSMQAAFDKIPSLGEFDLIYGSVDKTSALNQGKIAMFKFVRAFSLLPNPVPKKNGSSFKVYRKKVVKQVIELNAEFIFIDAFHLYAVKSIGYVPIVEKERKVEESNYNVLAKIIFLGKIILRYTYLAEVLMFCFASLLLVLFYALHLYNMKLLLVVSVGLGLSYFFFWRSRKLLKESFDFYIKEEL
jgi:dolichol-phosphate mannosyltransferase/undecaprenyl-phosphate 4-deoxy-4-formamido-L-arabinose transferase